MPRFINANIVEHHLQELIEKYENRMPNWSPNDELTSGKDTAFKYGYIADGVEKALETVKNAPTADVEPVRHGRWEDHYVADREEGFICTVCKELCECDFEYCPNCGAKMDGDNNG